MVNIEEILDISSNIERIGDHAINLSEYEDALTIDKLLLNDEEINEIISMQSICKKALDYLSGTNVYNDEFLVTCSSYEQKIDDMTRKYKQNHIDRMKEGQSSEEACIMYSELLLNFERIGDHILNIAQAMHKMK